MKRINGVQKSSMHAILMSSVVLYHCTKLHKQLNNNNSGEGQVYVVCMNKQLFVIQRLMTWGRISCAMTRITSNDGDIPHHPTPS